MGAEVVVQEDFQQHSGTLLEKLEAYIDSCDRVIALVGSAYGSEPNPTAIPKNAPHRSYTQWEYHFGKGERLDGTQAAAKQVYVYFSTPAYLERYPVGQSSEETQRQQQFVDEIRATGEDHNQFDSVNQLARLVLRDGFKLNSASESSLQNLPYDSLGPLFKGRDDFIAEIRADLSAGTEGATAIVAKQTIHGLGGVGKTRVAVEYAWRRMADYSACLFVVADAPEHIDRSIAELCGARVLDLPEKTEVEQEMQVAAALRWLNQHPGWLLILDNVDTPEAAAALEGLLPSLQNGHVLITSRRTDWGNNIRTLALDTLSDDDAVDYLLDKTKERRTLSEHDADAARILAEIMDGLALALEQASAFINRMRISLEDYRQRWTEQDAKLLNWHDDRAMDYPQSLATTWETSFAQLTPAAQALLNLLSWLAPDPIPRELFGIAFNAESLRALKSDDESEGTGVTQPPDLEDLLDELESLSLVKWQTGNRGFSIHRLVQEITQSRLGDDQRTRSLHAAADLINRALPPDPQSGDVSAWAVWDPLQPHIQQVIHAADAADITDPTNRLMNDFGVYLTAKSLFREAEPLLRRALAIDEASYGKEHPEVATELNNLAQLLQSTDRMAEAEPLSRRPVKILLAFTMRTKYKHPHLDDALTNHARLLQKMGKDKQEQQSTIRSLIESVKSRVTS